jgi:hypothetical protein
MSRSKRTIAMLLAAALLTSLTACDDEGEKGDTPETACCDPSEEPGQGGTLPCIEGASCCADGTWSCNEGNGEPTCDVCSAAGPEGETNGEDAEPEPPEAP